MYLLYVIVELMCAHIILMCVTVLVCLFTELQQRVNSEKECVIARATLDCVCYTGLCYTRLHCVHCLLWLLWFCILYHSQSIFVSTHVSHTVIQSVSQSQSVQFSSCLVLSCPVFSILYIPPIS